MNTKHTQESSDPTGDPAKTSAGNTVRVKIFPTATQREELEKRVGDRPSLADFVRDAVALFRERGAKIGSLPRRGFKKPGGTAGGVVLRLNRGLVGWVDTARAASEASRSTAIIAIALSFPETASTRKRVLRHRRITTAAGRAELREIAWGDILLQIQAYVEGHYGPVTAIEVFELLGRIADELSKLTAKDKPHTPPNGAKK